MFEHSVKVPRSYKLAASIAKKVKEEGASLKSLLYQEKNKHFPVQAVHALVVKTLQKENSLSELLKKTGILVNETRLDPWLARVLITELLWGKQSLTSTSKPVQTVLQYHKQFLSLLETLETKVENVEIKKALLKPRYIRVNTLLISAADAVRYFQDEGWNLIRCTSGSYDDFLKQVENLGPYDFMPDYHVKVVFVFAPNTPFYDCELYHNSQIFLQDKATCLAGYILSPTSGSTILDMCAAPGMKTTHLAAIIRNEGKIYSVEQDEERYNMLCEFVEKSGATCVQPMNKDVTTVKKNDCPNVDYVLLDPSCSGSGIRRFENNDSVFDLDSGRVQKLAAFQAKLLRHALNEYSTAKRIVYSTCSLYPEENEAVIQDVVRNHKGKFRLVSAREKLNKWNNVGNLKYKNIGEKCIYARPESDYTCGFFIACFEKMDEEEVVLNTEKKIKDSPSDQQEPHIIKQNDSRGECVTENFQNYSNSNDFYSSVQSTEKESSIHIEEKIIKKKKAKKENSVIVIAVDEVIPENVQKKKKKKEVPIIEEVNTKEMKKHKRKHEEIIDLTIEGKVYQEISLSNELEESSINFIPAADSVSIKSKKHKKMKESDANIDASIPENPVKTNKHKKKLKEMDALSETVIDENSKVKSKKKSRESHILEIEQSTIDLIVSEDASVGSKSKKRKRKNLSDDLVENECNVVNGSEVVEITKKKKKIKTDS